MSNPSRIEQLKHFLTQNPNDSFVKYALAIEHINLGDDETALSFFQSIVDSDPNYSGVYYHLGKLYERRKEKILAEKIYRDGLERTHGKDPHNHRELQEALNQLLYDEE